MHMLSERGYEELTYQIDNIDSKLFDLSNSLIDLTISNETKNKLNNQVDDIALRIKRLKEELLYY
jgi:hypothetical protein